MGRQYVAKILRVNLDNEKISSEEVDEQTLRKYIGGSGLGAKMLWEETTAATEPFSPENRLMFMVGPLTGNVPLSSRYAVCGISPANGAWGEANGGGRWPTELKRTGFSGVVFQGSAKRPVYLYVNDGEAEIRDASHLWGKDTYEVSDLIQGETKDKACVAAIGRAGENMVRVAGIINDGRMGRAAARCGLGAVMGSKKLKAVAVSGTRKPVVHDEARLKATRQEATRRLVDIRRGALGPIPPTLKDIFPSSYRRDGTLARNFSRSRFDSYIEKFRTGYVVGDPMYCQACPIGCLESHLEGGRRHMVGEAMGPLGSNCLIDDFKAIQEAYDLCNLYGMDTISVGFCIAFAMECFEERLITKGDTGGTELTWGNAQAMLEMVRQMGEAQGFGRVLGQGVKRAAEEIGGKASLYAMHVKGLEPAMMDPRGRNMMLIGYATSNRGAAHMECHPVELERKVMPQPNYFFDGAELGYPAPISKLGLDGKAGLVARAQDLGCVINAEVICVYTLGLYGVKVATVAEWLQSVTGHDIGSDELMKTGERIFNLQRLINLRRGLTAEDDTLPSRFLTRRPDLDESREHVPSLSSFRESIQEYYHLRGWTEKGVPTREKLMELDLAECLGLAAPSR